MGNHQLMLLERKTDGENIDFKMGTILLIILGFIIFCGIVREIITPPSSLLDFFLQLFCIDILGDILIKICEWIDEDW